MRQVPEILLLTLVLLAAPGVSPRSFAEPIGDTEGVLSAEEIGEVALAARSAAIDWSMIPVPDEKRLKKLKKSLTIKYDDFDQIWSIYAGHQPHLNLHAGKSANQIHLFLFLALESDGPIGLKHVIILADDARYECPLVTSMVIEKSKEMTLGTYTIAAGGYELDGLSMEYLTALDEAEMETPVTVGDLWQIVNASKVRIRYTGTEMLVPTDVEISAKDLSKLREVLEYYAAMKAGIVNPGE